MILDQLIKKRKLYSETKIDYCSRQQIDKSLLTNKGNLIIKFKKSFTSSFSNIDEEKAIECVVSFSDNEKLL